MVRRAEGEPSAGRAATEAEEVPITKFVKYGQTINLNLGGLCMGLVTSVIGATLLDISEIYDTKFSEGSHVITFRGFGALFGSLFGGILLDRYNTQVLILLGTFVASLAIASVPAWPYIPLAFAAMAIYGLTVGVFDTGANIWIINLWGRKNGPLLQIYHFAFGVGGLIAPLIAEPFLSLHQRTADDGSGVDGGDLEPSPFGGGLLPHALRSVTTANASASSLAVAAADPISDNATNSSVAVAAALKAAAAFAEALVAEPADGVVDGDRRPLVLQASRIEIPYGVIGAIHFALFVSMLYFYWRDPRDSRPPPTAADGAVAVSRPRRFALILLLATYLMVYVALEACLGQMLTTFAVKSRLAFTKSQASYLASTFWFSFTMGRAGAALWALVSSPRCMMFGEHAMSIFAFALFYYFSETNRSLVWLCTALVGVGAAGMFATVITWVVEYIPLTNKQMSVCTIFAGLGGMSPSFLVGRTIYESPLVLLNACSLIITVLTIIMLCILAVTSTMTPRSSMIGVGAKDNGHNLNAFEAVDKIVVARSEAVEKI